MDINEYCNTSGIYSWTDEKSEKKVSLKRKRKSCDEVPWTAGRCSRLLRSIDSRVAILQSISTTKSSLKANADTGNDFTHSRRGQRHPCPAETEDTTISKLADSPKGFDLEWLPQNQYKAAKRTYGSKTRRQQMARQSSNPKTFNFSTPFVRRMLQRPQDDTSDVDSGFESSTHDIEVIRPRKSRQLPIKASSSADEAQKNLILAFNNLLDQTKLEEAEPRTGAKCLRSICARKVPDYIQLEKDYMAKESKDHQKDDNLTQEIYDHLEDQFGTGKGWSDLRIIVRAHATAKVRAIVLDGMLPSVTVESAIDSCRDHQAFVEAQSLLKAHIEYSKWRRQSSLPDTISKLQAFSDQTNSQTFLFDNLHSIIELGPDSDYNLSMIPLEIWSKITAAYTKRTEVFEAERIVIALTLRTLHTSNQQATGATASGPTLPTILAKTLTLLTTMAATCLESSSNQYDSQNFMVKAIQRTLHAVTLIYLEAPAALRTKLIHQKIFHTALIGSLLIQITKIDSEDAHMAFMSIDEIVDVLQIRQTSGTAIQNASLIQIVSKYVARWDEDAAQHLTKTLINLLLKASHHTSTDKRHVLERLALESAESYSKNLTSRRSQDFISNIEAKICETSPARLPRTPMAEDNGDRGFRWDNGLCEFIARTPFAKADRCYELKTSSLAQPVHLAKAKKQAVIRERKKELKRTLAVRNDPYCQHAQHQQTLAERSPNLSARHPAKTKDNAVHPMLQKKAAPKCLKRASSAASLGQENAWLDNERDELGFPTPAPPKRRKHIGRVTIKSGLNRSLSLTSIASFADTSDDELCI